MNKKIIVAFAFILAAFCAFSEVQFQGSVSVNAGEKESIQVVVSGRGDMAYSLNGHTLIIYVEMQNASYLKFSMKPLGKWSWYRAKIDQSRKNGDKDREYSVYMVSEVYDYCVVRVVTRINVRVILDAQVCKSDGTFYFGVSRLDGEREILVKKEAELHSSLEKSSSRYQWKPSSGNWEYAKPVVMDKQFTTIQVPVFVSDGGTVPKYSTTWKDQKISGTVDGKSATTNFTIISVNVKLPNINESNEESVGAFIKTNTPVAVTFEIFPSVLPEELDEFEVGCGDLYKESNASEYSRASVKEREKYCVTGGRETPARYFKKFDVKQKIKSKMLKNLFLNCRGPSKDYLTDFVQITHKKSGAKDKACYTGYALSFLTPAGNPEKYEKDNSGHYLKVNAASSEPADWYVKKENNEEKDSGDGQNEFCFDDASRKLTVRLEAGIKPCLNADIANKLIGTDKGVFRVEKLRKSNGDGMPKWEGSGAYSLIREVGLADGKFKDKVVYEGYPNDSDGFGKYKATFTLKGETITADYEVFFPKNGTHHPICEKCSNCPNWFYYWKDGAVPGLAAEYVQYNGELSDKYYGTYDSQIEESGIPHYRKDSTGRIVKDESGEPIVEYDFTTHYTKELIYIPEMAAYNPMRSYVLTNQTGDTSLQQVIVVGKSEKYVGIVCAAAACVHEHQHKKISNDLIAAANVRKVRSSSLDMDGDGVFDPNERSKVYYIKTNVGVSDSYGFGSRVDGSMYSQIGDNEINARAAEREAYNYDIFKDWAKPGCQSKDEYGPIKK